MVRTPRTQDTHAAEQASDLYDRGYYCSEAVLKVVAEHSGTHLSDQALCMATGFGAGMGHAGAVCGALCGAVMAIGLCTVRTPGEGSDETVADAVRAVHRCFQEAHGSTSCADIVGPFGGMDGPGRHEHCRDITGACADWAVEAVARQA